MSASAQKVSARIDGGSDELRSMKDRTQNEYFDTRINNLRMELMNEIRNNEPLDIKDELNAQDLHIKQINMRMETIQSELRRIDRAVKT